MKRRTLLASAAALSLAAGAAFAQDVPKIGFVYVGPVNDGGWSQHHHESAMKMKEHFGDQIELVEQESVPEGADAERVLTQMALSGADLIFTTSFGYMDPTINVAEKFPDVKFEHATGYKRSDNLSTYSARFYEGRYVIGQMAAKMSKTGTAGYVGSVPIPEVVRGINSFMLGAQSVNPDFKLKIVWVNSWYDPGKEADAAKALLDQGAASVAAYITHGVLSGGAVARVDGSALKELVITDSIRPTDAAKDSDRIRILTIAPLIGEAVRRIADESSVSSLFD